MRFTPRRSSPRLPSFFYEGGYTYHLILNTQNGLPRFRDANLVSYCLRSLGLSAERYGFIVAAYCFMPNHLHLLVSGTERADLRRFVQHFKQATGFRHAGLWQRSYYDHIIRREEALENVARYIWDNPVQAGLARQVNDFPYSGPREALAAYAGASPPADVEDRAKALSLQVPIHR